MTLRTRLLLLVVLSTLPLVALQGYHAWELREARDAELHREASAQARILADEIDQIIGGLRQLLVAVALSPALRGPPSDSCNTYLAELQRGLPIQATLGASDRRGVVFCAPGAGRFEPGTLTNADRGYFRDAIRTGDFAVGDYAIGRSTGQAVLTFAYPVRDRRGEPDGVVFAPLRLDWLADYLNRRPFPKDSSITIVDRQGTILVRLPDRERMGLPVPDNWLPLVHAAGPATLRSRRSVDGVERVVAYIPAGAGPGGLMVAVGLSRPQAFAELNEATRRALMLMAAVLGLSMLAVGIAARRGIERPVAKLSAAARRWREGHYAARTGLGRGSSELHRLGETFDEMADALERREAERRQAEVLLRQSRDLAQQANASKTDFLAAASHDLRQPLQALQLNVALLARVHPQGQYAAVVGRMQRAVSTLGDLINALLDVAQLDSGKVQPRVAAVGLGGLLDALAEEFADVAASKQVRYEVVPCEAVVRSDPALLGRMMRNLVANAIKFTGPGGEVRVACAVGPRTVAIEVRDTGIGIPREHQQAIFEEFRQLANPERDRAKGLGLGLAIVDRMSRLLDHPVRLESEVGEGTRFWIEVPGADAPAAAAPEAPPAEPPTSELRLAGSVLLVEDDPDVSASTAQLLRSYGAHVVVADSAERAVELIDAASVPFDAVLSDYRLPGRPGLDAVLRAKARWPSVSVALITGDPAVRDIDRVRDERIPVLRKPVRLDQLGVVLQAVAVRS